MKSVAAYTSHLFYDLLSSGSSSRVEGGARNMKSMRPNSVAIFFMTYFYRAGGGHGGLAPPGSATDPHLIRRDDK